MGAGQSMLDSCPLDHRSWFAPSNRCSKATSVLWGTSKSVAEAKLCETKAETYQVKKPKCLEADKTSVGVVQIAQIIRGVAWDVGGKHPMLQ